MKTKNKKTNFFKILLISILILITSFIIIKNIDGIELTGSAITEMNYTYTRAICDKSNYCQDYEIICRGENLVSIIPIENAFVQQPKNWKDPRRDLESYEHCKKV